MSHCISLQRRMSFFMLHQFFYYNTMRRWNQHLRARSCWLQIIILHRICYCYRCNCIVRNTLQFVKSCIAKYCIATLQLWLLQGKHLYCHESVLGAICGSLYYHEVDFGAICGVIYCHESCLVAICGSLYYHEVDYGAIGGVLYCHAAGMVVIGGTFYYHQNIQVGGNRWSTLMPPSLIGCKMFPTLLLRKCFGCQKFMSLLPP